LERFFGVPCRRRVLLQKSNTTGARRANGLLPRRRRCSFLRPDPPGVQRTGSLLSFISADDVDLLNPTLKQVYGSCRAEESQTILLAPICPRYSPCSFRPLCASAETLSADNRRRIFIVQIRSSLVAMARNFPTNDNKSICFTSFRHFTPIDPQCIAFGPIWPVLQRAGGSSATGRLFCWLTGNTLK
jgi:hypothetical protein